MFWFSQSYQEMSISIQNKHQMIKNYIFFQMVSQKSGVIINMASICSSLKGAERRFAYGTTKGAVIGLTKSLAIDFVKDGIKVHCICPGTIDTPSFR